MIPSTVDKPNMPGIMVGMDQKDSNSSDEVQSKRCKVSVAVDEWFSNELQIDPIDEVLLSNQKEVDNCRFLSIHSCKLAEEEVARLVIGHDNGTNRACFAGDDTPRARPVLVGTIESALLNEFEDEWAILEHEDHDEEQLEIPSAAPSAAEHLGVPSEATTAAALSEAPVASEQSEAPAASKPATPANRMTESMEPALQGEVLPRMWSLVRTSKFPKYHSPGNQFERFRGVFGIDWQVRIRFSSVRKLFF